MNNVDKAKKWLKDDLRVKWAPAVPVLAFAAFLDAEKPVCGFDDGRIGLTCQNPKPCPIHEKPVVKCIACWRESKGWSRDGIPHDCKPQPERKEIEVEWEQCAEPAYTQENVRTLNRNLITIGKLLVEALNKLQ